MILRPAPELIEIQDVIRGGVTKKAKACNQRSGEIASGYRVRHCPFTEFFSIFTQNNR